MLRTMVTVELADPDALVLAPPRARRSRRRQFLTTVVLALLVGVICAYWVITDPKRVRPMAEHYLSKIVGGKVKVHRAYLSLFEGLRLEGVEVYVASDPRPDARLFTARTFVVRASLRALLAGRLEATRIVALDPHVRLCENLDAPTEARWNYMLLSRERRTAERLGPDRPLALPQILLRGGTIEYSRISRGRYEPVGAMAIDGQLNPDPEESRPNRYSFHLDSRAPGEPSGPRITGRLDMDAPSVSASLQGLEFNRAVRLMLPTQVQAWWESHQLSGRIRIPRFEFSPGQGRAPHSFFIEVQLEGVDLAVLPEELLGSEEYRRMRALRPCFPVGSLPELEYASRFGTIEEALQLRPVYLKNVDGRLVFTPEQIRIPRISGRIENNRVMVEGAIQGYSEDAPASLRLTAANLKIPRNPPYLASLPPVARKIHAEFRPSGRASLFFELRRVVRGGRLKASGEVVIHDGAFCFHEFAYPLRGITGSLILGPDESTGQDRLDLVNLRGYGVEGTRNAGNTVTVSGHVSPIDRGSAVVVDVRASNAWLDEALRNALPEDVRRVISMFDVREPAEGPATLQRVTPLELRGAFAASIRRAPGPKKPVTVDVDLDIAHGNGQFSGFGYPLRNVTGQVFVRPRRTIIQNMVARHGTASVRIDGQVDYPRNAPVEPKLKVRAANIPLDADLLSALPAEQRQWLKKGGGSKGLLDISGSVFLPPGAASASQTDFDLEIALRDGAIWPVGDTFALTEAAGRLHLTRSGLKVEQLTARRGTGQFAGSGTIAWPDDQPRFSVKAKLTAVPLDEVLYATIPASAQKQWKAMNPQGGSVDVEVSYDDGRDGLASAAPASANYEVVIRPRYVSIEPGAFPWRMGDVSGVVTITPKRTVLRDVTLHHGAGTLKLDGWSIAGQEGAWDLTVRGRSIAVDTELRRALGESVRGFADAIKLGGSLSFDCPELQIRKPSADAAAQVAIRKASVSLSSGSLEVGIPCTSVSGGLRGLEMELDGSAVRSLSADIDIPSMQLADRPAGGFRGKLKKLVIPGQTGHNVYRFVDLEAKLAGGLLAIPQVDLDLPEQGPAAYGLRLVLKDVLVQDLLADIEDDVRGRLTASLDLHGRWSDPSSRVGRGDVLVQGKELYRLPVVFGWLQVANLAMPVKSPFTEATATYNIAGHKLVLDPIVLRTSTVTMQGSGWLDFASKRLAMTFLTDNPKLFRIPVLTDILEVAKDELLPIHITGSITEPQVKVRSLHTFTTTIDEVLKDRAPRRPARPGKAGASPPNTAAPPR